MNSMERLNEAMNYLEKHLTGNIDAGKMARIAGCSEYTFRRMFSFLAGMSLGEYIRNRKLSLAAELLQAGRSVTDCAADLGYESPDTFSKAFRAVHGVPPSRAAGNSGNLRMFPPLSFQLALKGGKPMNYRIESKGPFFIAGFKKRITLQFEGINPQMEELTGKLTPEIIRELKELNSAEPRGILQVSADFSDRTREGSPLDQWLGVAVDNAGPVPKRFAVLPVDRSDWAVFTAVGPFPEALQETWGRIYSEWLPASGYDLTGGPEILRNESPDTGRRDYKSEIWIPVRKRKPEPA